MTIIDEGVKDVLKKSILLAFCFILCGCLLVSCSEENQTTSENDYELYMSEVRYSSQHMPDIEELGNYEDIVIKTKTIRQKCSSFYNKKEYSGPGCVLWHRFNGEILMVFSAPLFSVQRMVIVFLCGNAFAPCAAQRYVRLPVLLRRPDRQVPAGSHGSIGIPLIFYS